MELVWFLGNGFEVGECDPTVLHAQCEGGSDYTLCGTTMDGDTHTAGGYELVEARFVTCPHCGCQTRSPFGGGKVIHDIDGCAGVRRVHDKP